VSFRETVRVIQPGQRRLKIFVDFWNLMINARSQTSFEIDFHWDKLAKNLVGQTHRGYGDESHGDLAGCYVFGSYSKSDAREKAFINRTLDKYGSLQGLFFDFSERIKKETSAKCPTCNEAIAQSSEAGVDVLLTVEMIKHAAMREHDYLALVSSDRDFLPLLSYFKDQGQRVLHVATGSAHREMRSLTWAQIELKDHYPNFCSIVSDGRLVLTDANSDKVTRVKEFLDNRQLKYSVVDISNAEDISDKDLNFLIRNQNMFFYKPGDVSRGYSPSNLSTSIHEFRKLLAKGQIEANLPYVINNGQMEAYFERNRGTWTRAPSPEAQIWTQFPL
jgi:uncharacterized LabA/DUF88 family protein